MVSKQPKTSTRTTVIRQALKPMARRNNKVAKNQRTQRARRVRARTVGTPAGQPVFGPVATIDSAPISIGNTINGCQPIITPTNDGVRVRGRDFLLTCQPTSTSFTGWQVCGGAPITPACMPSSVLKSYWNMYAEYQVHAVAFHFITAAITTDAGSIMMYVGKDRAAPGLNPSSANLLPFVLSDPHTVISPIWKNASSVYHPAPTWYTTAVDNDEGLHEQSPGEYFILSKVTQADAPGYVLIDYDISFRVHQVNLKTSVFPAARMKYTEVNIEMASASTTVDVTVPVIDVVGGNLLDGATVSTNPTGNTVGDIYKVILTINGAAFSGSGIGITNILDYDLGGGLFADVVITDGMTLYMACTGTNTYVLYPTYYNAVVGSRPLLAGATNAGLGFSFHAFVSLVGANSGALLQSNF